LIGTLVIAVLPANEQQQDQLFSRAATAVRWTTTFCDRNGTACAKAGEILGTLASKAKFGATMAYDMALRYSDNAGGYLSPVRYGPERGTLRPEDLEPAWRGGPPGAGA
jgi:hypothetical protein